MSDYISYRIFQEVQKEIKEEKLRKIATLLTLVENAEDPEVQSAIFEEVDLNPADLTIEDFFLLEELTGLELF